jgi:mannosylglycoprotein endo-beta-mannosidase
MLEEEELYWHKRSHGVWLHKGDNNTKFFHMIANGRKRKNTIMYLNSEEGRIKGDENLLKHATEYYKNLFGQGTRNAITLDPDLSEDWEKVSDPDNDEITKPFSETEIKEALDQMEKNKAAGPDEIPIEFYQYSWEIIKEDILEMFRDFHEGVWTLVG